MSDAENPGFFPKTYRRDCMPSALSALFMLVGDRCLSVIPQAPATAACLPVKHI